MTGMAKTTAKTAPKAGHAIADTMKASAKAMETGAALVESMTRQAERATKSGGSRRRSRS